MLTSNCQVMSIRRRYKSLNRILIKQNRIYSIRKMHNRDNKSSYSNNQNQMRCYWTNSMPGNSYKVLKKMSNHGNCLFSRLEFKNSPRLIWKCNLIYKCKWMRSKLYNKDLSRISKLSIINYWNNIKYKTTSFSN